MLEAPRIDFELHASTMRGCCCLGKGCTMELKLSVPARGSWVGGLDMRIVLLVRASSMRGGRSGLPSIVDSTYAGYMPQLSNLLRGAPR